MKNYVMWKTLAEDFVMTTRENYNARISDANKVCVFKKSEGFLSFEDALDCARQWCHVTADDVEIIQS